ncbi:MAG TPA: dethiobiotin synthase [Solirubrobacterales bacterium]|nr:dethiobiotin synthase [Solirubrobacterales bacterium]
MRGFFVTGTGTEVGKTVVAAAVANTARAEGARVAVFKPAVSGLKDYPLRPEVWECAAELPDHALLRLAAGSRQGDDEIAPYRYGPPFSPHLAAELPGEEIDPDRLRGAALAATQDADLLICEGVGGFLVPLRASYLVRDLAWDLGLPVVIAAPPGLGTINHTLLTIEAVRDAGLEVATIVLTPWPDRPAAMELSNRRTIERLGSVPVEALPRLDLRAPDSWPLLPIREPVLKLRQVA